jgi:hypothetical protein
MNSLTELIDQIINNKYNTLNQIKRDIDKLKNLVNIYNENNLEKSNISDSEESNLLTLLLLLDTPEGELQSARARELGSEPGLPARELGPESGSPARELGPEPAPQQGPEQLNSNSLLLLTLLD